MAFPAILKETIMEQDKRLWWIQELGLDVLDDSKEEWQCICPYCDNDKKDHFHFNVTKLTYHCKICTASGNYVQLMAQLATNLAEALTNEELYKLSKNRKLPIEAFEGLEIGFTGIFYTLPVRNIEGKIANVLRYKPESNPREKSKNKLCNAPGCGAGLFGAQHLGNQSRKNEPIYLMEGPWDVIAFDWLRTKIKAPGIVIGVLGAGNLPREYIPNFRGRFVYVIQDNDEPGYKGESRIASMLTEIADTVKYYRWQDNDTIGKDIRDLITEVIDNES